MDYMMWLQRIVYFVISAVVVLVVIQLARSRNSRFNPPPSPETEEET